MFNNKKTQRIFAGVIAVVMIAAMLIGLLAGF